MGVVLSVSSASRDGLDVLSTQHHTIRQQLAVVADQPAIGRRAAFDLLCGMIARHEATEALLLRPITRASVVGGELIADSRAEEEDYVRRTLDVLAEDIWSEDFPRAFGDLAARLVAHMDREETYEFPIVRAYRDGDAAVALASVVGATPSVVLR